MSLTRDRCVMWTVNVNDQKSLILVKSNKKLDFINIQMMLNQVYLDNEGKCSWYDRFVDLSDLKDVEGNLGIIRDHIQLYHKMHPLHDDVKFAVYSPFSILRSMIEFYEQETQDSEFKLKISSSLDECADYLCVDKASLQP
jgi:hypothetical protein